MPDLTIQCQSFLDYFKPQTNNRFMKNKHNKRREYIRVLCSQYKGKAFN